MLPRVLLGKLFSVPMDAAAHADTASLGGKLCSPIASLLLLLSAPLSFSFPSSSWFAPAPSSSTVYFFCL